MTHLSVSWTSVSVNPKNSPTFENYPSCKNQGAEMLYDINCAVHKRVMDQVSLFSHFPHRQAKTA